MIKDLNALVRLEARKRKSPHCIQGEEMYTLGKLRHQKKSFSPLSEFRQEKVLLAFERVQAG